MRYISLLLLVTSCTPRVSKLTVSYRSDNRCAPLYAACLYGRQFRQRYGIWLKPVKPRERYFLYSGCRPVLELLLESQPSDKRVAERLMYGDVPVGIVAPEDVMRAVLDSFPVHIVAPLQSGGDILLIHPDLPIDSWTSFTDYLRRLNRPLRFAYVPREPNCLFAFEQALEYENLRDKAILYRMTGYDVMAQGLIDCTLDGAVLANPAATEVALATGCRTVCRLNDLPPNRFENSPSTVIAAYDSAIQAGRTAIESFLELMACATHFANEQTAATRVAARQWLETTTAEESASSSTYRFSSLPDWYFRSGIWNWFFALRLKNQVPARYAGLMDVDEWFGIPYDSSLVIPAIERAGARIIR